MLGQFVELWLTKQLHVFSKQKTMAVNWDGIYHMHALHFTASRQHEKNNPGYLYK